MTIYTGHNEEMEYLENLDTKEIESAKYSIESREKEIEQMRSDMGTDEMRGDLLKYKYNDEYRTKKIAEKQAHIEELKNHYNL